MEKNAKIVPFFYKERKRTQRSFRSFIKNGKECKDRSVLLKRTDAQPWFYFRPFDAHTFKSLGHVWPKVVGIRIKCTKIVPLNDNNV